ncbi:hypothetical protein ACFOLL_12915 [Falsochrobactrum ovis]|uniref:Uncharacterized protein n=1 Tax=Falsochrobactrum ovis TaxID=1293442 RepID=A0A364JTK2_9HYPH|nr:hypothetical protein C7374_111110 [Falsochrobactrum ovis]
MAVRPFDEIFRDFVINGLPASGPHHPEKKDIRDSLNALVAGPFPDNRVIKLNNANEGTENNIVVSASVEIPTAVYQVLYILNVTQENTGPVTISGAINRKLVTNTNEPVPAGYLKPGMAVLCVDTGSELRMLSYGDAEAIQDAAEAAASRAEDAAALAESAAGGLLSNFDSVASVEASNIPAPVNYIRTAGYYAAGDGGGALYKRVASEPSHAGKVQSADGAWWELTGWQSDVKKFNVITTPSDSTLALQRAVNYAVENGGSIPVSTETLYITEPIIIKPTKTVPEDILSSDVHFKDYRAIDIFGSARHKIKAAPGFVGGELLRFTYNDTISTQAPMWSQVSGIVLDGSDLVDTAILLEWCMNVEIRRIGVIGTARGVRNIGYGVSNIERSAFRCSSAGVDFSEGGGDSWITKNDFYCPSGVPPFHRTDRLV